MPSSLQPRLRYGNVVAPPKKRFSFVVTWFAVTFAATLEEMRMSTLSPGAKLITATPWR
ncbi:MAG: hypothetical protein WC565_03625 [Parcubacteria group bacterium]